MPYYHVEKPHLNKLYGSVGGFFHAPIAKENCKMQMRQ